MKLDAVKPINIDEHLGKPMKNRVALVGVELEGGWVTLPPGVAQLEHDGSVFQGQLPVGAAYMGECTIGPLYPAGIGELLKTHYPPKINHTCGMHVHMSFELLWQYHLLMVPEYQETVLHYLTLWAKEHPNVFGEKHHIWERLAGKSRYCQKQFWPDAQAGTKRKGHDQTAYGHRYTAIHYCGRFNTIECRVLPMMPNTKLALSAINRLIEITNACVYELGRKRPRPSNLSTAVKLPDNMLYEEHIIERL